MRYNLMNHPLAGLPTIAAALVLLLIPQRTCASTVTMRAMDVQVGVAVHIDGYGSVEKTVSSLHTLGVSRVRVDSPQPRYMGRGNLYDALCNANIKITPFLNGWIEPSSDQTEHAEFAATKALERAHPGCIERIEGPNEINNFPQTYGGLTGTASAQAFQRALYKRVREDPILRSKQVIGYTDIHPVASSADYGNMHVYEGSWCADPAFQTEATEMQKAMPGKPMASTEWGYTTPATLNDRSVSKATQALRIECGIAAALWNKVNPAFIYELKDEGTSANNNEQNYGLLNYDWSQKPSAQRLQRLLAAIKDEGPATFTPVALTVTANDPAIYSILLAKSDGSYLLLVWTCAGTPRKRDVEFKLSTPKTIGFVPLGDGIANTWTKTASFSWAYMDGSGLALVTLR